MSHEKGGFEHRRATVKQGEFQLELGKSRRIVPIWTSARGLDGGDGQGGLIGFYRGVQGVGLEFPIAARPIAVDGGASPFGKDPPFFALPPPLPREAPPSQTPPRGAYPPPRTYCSAPKAAPPTPSNLRAYSASNS
jgi:hypothetical protein